MSDPKRYVPPEPTAPPPAPVPEHPWQCQYGCGKSFVTMQGAQSHESSCSRRPK